MSLTEQAQSQMISILPINNSSFTPGQKVIFELPPDLGFLKAARGESYLAIKVRNNSTALRWMFPTSAQSLIKDVNVFSMATGQQLESLQNYNQAVWLLNQYGSVVHGMQQSVEGMVSEPFSLEWGTSTGAPIRRKVYSDGTPDTVMNSIISPIDESGNLVPLAYQICIPLRLGIFGSYSDEKLTPLLSLGGLRIEITLEDKQPVCNPLGALVGGGLYPSVSTPDQGLTTGIPVVQGSSLQDIVLEQCTTLDQTGFCVGQNIEFQSGTSTDISTTIQSMTVLDGVSVQLTCQDIVHCGGISGKFATLPETFTSNVNYAIDDIQFRVLQVVPDKQTISNASKPMNYGFRTYDLYYDSIPAGSKRHQVEIHSVSSRAKSIMSMIYDSSLEYEPNAPAYFKGSDPDTLSLNSVQFFINNKLFPLNAYNPSRVQDRPQSLNELSKAFSAMGTPLSSFGDGSGKNLDSYSNTFLVARELARGDFVYDLRSAEPSIRLGFSATRSQISRVNTFVWSDRVINIGPSGLSLII